LELTVFSAEEVEFALLGLEQLLGEFLVAGEGGVVMVGEGVVEGGGDAGVGGDRLVLS
jgi:hypothetical protein